MKTKTERETVGRKYQLIRYGVHSRQVNSGGSWGGLSHYKTFEEAKAAVESMGKPLLGGLVSFAGGESIYEYRIVRVVSECEVMHTELKKL